jgi:hypothetical protein
MSTDTSNDQAAPVEVITASALSALVRADIDCQIATAKSYPRSITQFKKAALNMATLDEETAAGCFYSLPRAKKRITGPSVRMAEIVASAWGNLRCAARVIGDDGRIITAQAACHDLERNVAIQIEAQRRVTDKQGRRYSDDMVVMTGNAACSIALRNAIFRVVPGVYVKDITKAAKLLAVGDAKSLASRRDDMIQYFGKMGIDPERVAAAVEKASIEDIGLDELAELKGLATAIKDGDTSIDEAFPAPQAAPKTSTNGGSKAQETSAAMDRKNAPPPEQKDESAQLRRDDAPSAGSAESPQQTRGNASSAAERPAPPTPPTQEKPVDPVELEEELHRELRTASSRRALYHVADRIDLNLTNLPADAQKRLTEFFRECEEKLAGAPAEEPKTTGKKRQANLPMGA